MNYTVLVDGTEHKVELRQEGNTWKCSVDGTPVELDAAITARDVLSVLVDGRQFEIKREYSLAGETHIIIGSERFEAEVRDPRSLVSRRAAAGVAHGPAKITAPMPGKVVRILAALDAEVEAGQAIVVVEAMKMQNEIKSPKKGVVKKITIAEGATVNAGDVLAIIE